MLMSLQAMSQSRFYVKYGISDNNNSGKTWDRAMADLQKAINRATSGDTVFVSAGIYKGNFVMKEGVTVLGGYTGNRTAGKQFERIYPGDASSSNQLTILDGDGAQRVVTQIAPFSKPTYWEGFVIQNGKPSDKLKSGDVIYGNQSDVIAGVIFRYDANTKTGLMIAVDEAKKQWGGYQSAIPGLPNTGTSQAALADMDGKGNTAKIVAKLSNTNMDFSSETYELNGNYAAQWCDTLKLHGYDNWFLPSCGELEELYQNGDAAGVLNGLNKGLSGGYWTSTQAGDILALCYYFETGNTYNTIKYSVRNVRPVREFQLSGTLDDVYSYGGGVLLNNNGILMNCIVRNNETPTLGGGVYAGAGSKVLGCLIYGNKAEQGGSGIYACESYTTNGIASANIINSTIAYNSNSAGIASEEGSTQTSTYVMPVVQNSIVWGNSLANGTNAPSAGKIAFSNSCVQFVQSELSVIIADPKFVSTTAGQENFLLQDDSPCLKTGNTNAVTAIPFFKRDLQGYTRALCMYDGRKFVDMGAYQQGETDYSLKLEKNITDNQIKVAPNPVKAGQKILLSVQSEETNTMAYLFNSAGQIIFSQSITGLQTELVAPSETGMYFLQVVKSSGETENSKIVVY